MDEREGSLQRPWRRVVLAQGLAVVLLLAAVYGLALLSSLRLPLWQAALAQGALAAAIGWRLGLSRWWLGINLAFLPALWLLQQAALPGWLYLLGFVLLLLVNWNSLHERVPLYLSGTRARQQLGDWLAAREAPPRFVDLGCGTAGTLLHLARRFPRGRFVGVESAPLLFLLAWLRCLGQGNCSIRYGSLWRTELAPFDVVYCFLSPVPMARLWAKAREEMAPGSWLISNSFAIPGVAPNAVRELNQGRQTQLLLWQIGGAVIR